MVIFQLVEQDFCGLYANGCVMQLAACLTCRHDVIVVMQVKVMNGKILNKRTLKVSIATDNGRAKEFIRRRVHCSYFSSLLWVKNLTSIRCMIL